VSFQISYGQTEACGCTHSVRDNDPSAVKAKTVGQPLPQVEVRISDPAAVSTQPAGTVGEVLVRGNQVMKNYRRGCRGLPQHAAPRESSQLLRAQGRVRLPQQALCSDLRLCDEDPVLLVGPTAKSGPDDLVNIVNVVNIAA